MGDDVVQLAPDPGLLFGDRPPGLQFLLAAAARGAGPQLTDVGAGQPRKRRETQAEHRGQADLLQDRGPPGPPPSRTSGQARTAPVAMPAQAACRRGQYAATEYSATAAASPRDHCPLR